MAAENQSFKIDPIYFTLINNHFLTKQKLHIFFAQLFYEAFIIAN
jgi:hypothetical protein